MMNLSNGNNIAIDQCYIRHARSFTCSSTRIFHFDSWHTSIMRYCYFLDTNSHKVGDVYGCFFFRPAQNCEILAEKGQFKS